MQRLIAFGVLLFTLSSVQRQPPSEVLARDQMVSILVDLELAKAMAWFYADDEDTAGRLFKKNALLIYEAHDTDPDTFQKSYQYYLTHLEVMKEIYEVVIKRLEELKAQV